MNICKINKYQCFRTSSPILVRDFHRDLKLQFPVPYFTKKLQLQIRQCPLALLTTFFGVKTRSSDPSMKSHKDLDEIPGKLPRASFCHVCLYFSRSLLASYLTPEAWRVVNKLSHFEGPELKFSDSRAGSRFSPRARFARLHFVRRNSRLRRSQRK